MKFRNLTKVFDTIDTFDGYSGRFLYKSQPGTFESSSPEGNTSKRRVLGLSPDYVIPTRRCVTLMDETWVVGDASHDGMFNRIMRRSYWMRRATDLFTLQQPGAACTGSTGTQAYGLQEYLKDIVDPITSARYDPQYEVSFSLSEAVSQGMILRSAENLLTVRSVRRELAGFYVATADEIGLDAVVTATFTTGTTYTPSTDTYNTVSTAVGALIFERIKLYELRTHADPTYLQGDRTMLVAKASITPLPDQQFTAASQTWRVVQVTDYHDAWLLHVRVR